MMVSVFDVDMVFSAPEGLQAALLSLVKGRDG
jgi:hypothetical protein